ncbi:alpha-1-antitrypsin homolog [Poecilia latipinna]|uniref:Serpin peptidase inhibitor, clade A (alpha-1 antiproteinase, antitrypsin), member 1 n=1 Tax=Poecilia latipinna TaxID=48699 RepID=A0A3B3VXY5_9TELE|nr:PREDICTED: alpha-1-antitrypsin homolog [Poecilia latipinna]
MHGIFASCTLAALLLAVARADHHLHHEGMRCHVISSPNADFAFALYRNINGRTAPGKNIFMSPLGLSTALSMLSTGARGKTHAQLFSSLGYADLDQARVNEAYTHLFQMLGQSQQEQKLHLGNSVAVRIDLNPLQAYLTDIQNNYGGEVFKVDFSNPAEAVGEINRHVASKTQDKIKDIVKDLDPSMALVLINYVYFRGQWERPFDKNLTEKADFHVNENTKVEVDMMKKMGRFDYYQDHDNHTTIISLPYKGNTSMLIVLPDENKMEVVEGFINKDYLRHWHDSLYKNNLNLYMPKFSISVETSMDETLKEMGITEAYSDMADFSAISEEIKLKVSKVSHQAVLSVDETGTEAAAATTIEIMPMSLPIDVRLNRPFLVFIIEHSTRSIIFAGKISNPTAA